MPLACSSSQTVRNCVYPDMSAITQWLRINAIPVENDRTSWLLAEGSAPGDRSNE